MFIDLDSTTTKIYNQSDFQLDPFKLSKVIEELTKSHFEKV